MWQFVVDEVVHPNLLGLALRVPLAPGVLELPYEFLLLCVYRDHGLALALELPHHLGDVLKLRVAVGMLGAFARLAHRLQAVVELGQQVANRALTHPMAASNQFGGQSCRALARPAQRRHRIAPAAGFDQGIKIGEQARIDIHQALASAAGGSNALVRSGQRRGPRGSFGCALGLAGRLDLGQASVHGRARQPCNFGHHADTTTPKTARFGCSPQSQRRLVQASR